jgi:3-isopropylmalate/(R)-2-methylmalate dehydratase small subunit
MIKGTAHKFGDDVDTDQIISAKYLITTDAKELGKHCMETADENFVKNAKPGDVMIAGTNFGCGSSREHAPISIKGVGVSVIIAESFARIFFRNCINIGMPIIEHPQAAKEIKAGDQLEVDLDKGLIKNITQNKTYQAAPFPEFMQNIVNAGGLMAYVKQRLAAK